MVSSFITVYEAKERLNWDFFQNARIRDAVSILYYPFIEDKYKFSHCEIEVEDACYSFRNKWSALKFSEGNEIPKVASLRRRVFRYHRDFPYPFSTRQGKPYWKLHSVFIRFHISVTPIQLSRIQNHIEEIRSITGLTCMEAVNRFLKMYCNYSIPFPFCIYPPLSTTSLVFAKNVFGSSRVTRIDTEIFDKAHPEGTYDPIISTLRKVYFVAVLVVLILQIM